MFYGDEILDYIVQVPYDQTELDEAGYINGGC
jgi:hypothetical protein